METQIENKPKNKKILKTILIIIIAIIGIILLSSIFSSSDENNSTSDYENISSVEWVAGSEVPVEHPVLRMTPDEFIERFNNANKSYFGEDNFFVHEYTYINKSDNHDSMRDFDFSNYLYSPMNKNNGIYVEVIDNYISGAYSVCAVSSDTLEDANHTLPLQCTFILYAMGEKVSNYEKVCNEIKNAMMDSDTGKFEYKNYTMLLSENPNVEDLIQIYVYKNK